MYTRDWEYSECACPPTGCRHRHALISNTMAAMKQGIHPKYEMATIKCACGAVYTVGSTAKNVHVGICAACHPFFTGKQKYLDTAGRVEKFKKRYSAPPAPPSKKALKKAADKAAAKAAQKAALKPAQKPAPKAAAKAAPKPETPTA